MGIKKPKFMTQRKSSRRSEEEESVSLEERVEEESYEVEMQYTESARSVAKRQTAAVKASVGSRNVYLVGEADSGMRLREAREMSWVRLRFVLLMPIVWPDGAEMFRKSCWRVSRRAGAPPGIGLMPKVFVLECCWAGGGDIGLCCDMGVDLSMSAFCSWGTFCSVSIFGVGCILVWGCDMLVWEGFLWWLGPEVSCCTILVCSLPLVCCTDIERISGPVCELRVIWLIGCACSRAGFCRSNCLC